MKQQLIPYLFLITFLVESCNNLHNKPVVHELEKGDYYISGDFKHNEGVEVIAQGSNVPSEMILSAAPYQSNYASEELTQIYKHTLTPLPNAYTEEKVLKIIKPGQDGRSRVENTKKWPYSFHSQLSLTFSGGEYSGSGLLVGPQHILTCGHNVYDHTNKQGWVQRIEVRPALNGTSAPYGHALVKRIYAFQGWTSQGHTSYDMALLILDRPMGYKTGWCGLLAAPTKELKKSSVHITGYPGDKESNQLWTMNHTLKEVQAEELVYLIDTHPGQSGSGIWLNSLNDYFTSSVSGGPYAVGVHTQGSNSQNSGVRLSYSKAKQLVGWISETLKLKETITSSTFAFKNYSLSNSNTLSTKPNTFSSNSNSSSFPQATIDLWAKEVRNGNKDALMKLLNASSADHYVQNTLGCIYFTGEGVPKSYKEAKAWFKKAGKKGYASSQTNLGIVYYYGGDGVPQDFEKAKRWFEQAAQQEQPDAENYMALIYYYGYGIPQDYKKAMEWLQKAAQKGHADAQTSLGTIYYNGYGVPQDYKKAKGYFEKAAQQGHADAQNALGVIYYNGDGVSKDYQKAKGYFEKAAQQGHADAQNALGGIYYNGDGVSKDYQKAREWYEKAAQQGHADAQNALGVIYYNGEGVSKDYKKAREWFEKAAQQGHADAQTNLKNIDDDGCIIS